MIGICIESFSLTSSGTIYDLVVGGQFQYSTNSGKMWSVVNTQTESYAITSAGTLYDLEVGGQLSVAPGVLQPENPVVQVRNVYRGADWSR